MSAGGPSLEEILRRPERLARLPPCQHGCPSGSDVRTWIGWIAQRNQLGISLEVALERAWTTIVERNPLPATMGRICPHPCESGCNRDAKDGPVAIHELERYIGDWAIERALRLPVLEREVDRKSVGVVGSGPAGLSFAYQMRRRGHRVRIYESADRPGGMLRHGIPEYRLPERVLAAEIDRILDLGVELTVGCAVGRDVTLEELRRSHAALFLGVGAQASRRLGIPGEAGPGCLGAIEFLREVNAGRAPELGARVAVVGGGNSAVDAARTARRLGSETVLLYRRTREEMPAFAEEVDAALEEGVRLEILVAPRSIVRDGERLVEIELTRMRLGEPDASGRRAPEPIAGSGFAIGVDTVLAAVSQELDRTGLESLVDRAGWLAGEDAGALPDGVSAGGDARGAGIATLAIAQGRHAAEAMAARLRGQAVPAAGTELQAEGRRVRLDWYPARERNRPETLPPAERLRRPEAEVGSTLTEDAALNEAARCLSCGACMGCQQCFMYCNPTGFTRLDEVAPGAYFAFDLSVCEGCGKCVEICPCGFLSPR